jgi:hypothetical protein
MATVLEECNVEELLSVVRFLWEKVLSAMKIHKKMFPVYSAKCLWPRAVHNWVEKFSQGPPKVAEDARLGAEVPETTVKRTQCCGFGLTGKAMGQVYQCWWRICREICVLFHVRISHVLCFISIYDPFTDYHSYY